MRLIEAELIPYLFRADEKTHISFARLVLRAEVPITKPFVLMLRDRLLGELPDWRWSEIIADNDAAYVYRALGSAGAGYGGWGGYYEPSYYEESYWWEGRRYIDLVPEWEWTEEAA